MTGRSGEIIDTGRSCAIWSAGGSLPCCPTGKRRTVRAWLSKHPAINIVSRDRGGGYGEAAAKALPNAIQVADRWHLMENASAAFLDAVRRSMNRIRTAIGATTIDPELLTCAEKLRYQGYLRRQDSHAVITALVSDGVPLKEIVRRTGHSRNLVRQISRGGGTDMFRTRQSTLDGHLPFLDAQWSGGCRNGAELWRRLKGQGFKGSLRVVAEWATRRRRAETTSHQQLQKVPAARTIAQLMTTKRDHLTNAETVTLAVIEQNVPMLRNPGQSGHRFRRKAATDSDRKRPPDPNECGHPVDRVRRGALSAI
ncbi:transposase [Bradyrhizobium sp. GM7.3]